MFISGLFESILIQISTLAITYIEKEKTIFELEMT